MGGKRKASDTVPKAKAGEKKAAKAKAKPKPLVVKPCTELELSKDSLNAHVLAHLASCDATTLKEECFAGILEEPPNGTCGLLPYDAGVATAKLSKGEPYCCAAPLWWLNLNWELQPGVPKYKCRLDCLQKHFFSKAAFIKKEVLVYVEMPELPHLNKGQLLAFDSPEIRDAFRQALAAAVNHARDMEITDRQEALKPWKDAMLSVPFRFKAIEAEQHVTNTLFSPDSIIQEREDVGVLHENMRTSALMRSFEVMDLKRQLESGENAEKQTKQSLRDKYSDIKMAKGSEPVTVTFVEQAQMIHNSAAMSSPRVRNILLRFDEQGLENPMDSLHKIREVIVQSDKTKTDNLEWNFEMLFDFWQTCSEGGGKRDNISLGLLEGKMTGWNGKSLPQLFLYKRSLLHFLWKTMEKMTWHSEVKELLRSVTVSVVACRRHLGTLDKPAAFEQRAGWPESADALLLAIESLVYSYQHDEKILASLKNRKSVEECLKHADLKHFMEAVDKTPPDGNVDDENDGVGEGEDDGECAEAGLKYSTWHVC